MSDRTVLVGDVAIKVAQLSDGTYTTQLRTIQQIGSTLIPLAANGVYTSPQWTDVSYSKNIVGSVYSDVPGTLVIEQSWDGINADVKTQVDTSSGSFVADVKATKVRAVYTNGTTDQTIFRLYVGSRA